MRSLSACFLPKKIRSILRSGQVKRIQPRLLPSDLLQENPVVDQVHLLDSSSYPFLLSKDVLEIKLVLFRPENRDILQDELFFVFSQYIGIGAPRGTLVLP